MTDLLPCPFCGKLPQSLVERTGGADWWTARCDNTTCGIMPKVTMSSRAGLLRSWNRRAPTAPAAAGVSALLIEAAHELDVLFALSPQVKRSDVAARLRAAAAPQPGAEAGGWVSVLDRKPTDCTRYLVALSNGDVQGAFYDGDPRPTHCWMDGAVVLDVTHWMPMPLQPPPPAASDEEG